MMTKKCLIIAAGKGSRLQLRGDSKPLIPVLGMPLIERVIRAAQEGGLDDFYVVTGYQKNQVADFLKGLAGHLKVSITPLINDEWEKDNGLSVLKGKDCLKDSFILLMSDHLFDPEIIHILNDSPMQDGEVSLCVDGNTQNPLVDLKDVTRVVAEGGKVRDIGKGLDEFNGFDSGIFKCTPAIFDAIEKCSRECNDTSLSGGVSCLADEGRVNAVDISGRFWVDVDDPEAIRRAENAVLDYLQKLVNQDS